MRRAVDEQAPDGVMRVSKLIDDWNYDEALRLYEETDVMWLPRATAMLEMEDEKRYQACELTKLIGSKMISSKSSSTRSYGLLLIIDAHYVRANHALRSASAEFRRRVHGKRYSPGYDLDIDVYTNHWLHAMRDHPEYGKASKDFLVNHGRGYKPTAHKYLPDCMTMYQESA